MAFPSQFAVPAVVVVLLPPRQPSVLSTGLLMRCCCDWRCLDRPLSCIAIKFPLQGGNPSLPQAMPTATCGLEMLLRSDVDQLYRMLVAANFDRALVAAVVDLRIIEVIAEALTRPFEKFRFRDTSCHGKNVWGVASKFSSLLWLVTGLFQARAKIDELEPSCWLA